MNVAAFEPIEPREYYDAAIAELEQPLTNEDLLELVCGLPVLAVHVLALASSSAYAGSVPINRLDHAVILLGQREIHRLANDLYSRVLTAGPLPEEVNALREIVEQATVVSRAAELVARATRLPLGAEARTAGLLLDLGIAYQLRQHPTPMGQAIEDATRTGSRLLEHERMHLGTDHCETVKSMLLAAGISQEIATAVEYHHDPLNAPTSLRFLAAILYAGDCLALRERRPSYSTQASLPLESKVLSELRLTHTFFREHAVLLGDEPSIETRVDQPRASHAPEARPRILCVDDNERNLLILEELLGEDYLLTMVASGEEALAALEGSPPALILLDVMMKGISGIEACRRIKMNPATVSVPVILVTALSSDDERGRGLAAGADAYVVKPFDPDRLLDTIEALLPRTAETS